MNLQGHALFFVSKPVILIYICIIIHMKGNNISAVQFHVLLVQ